VGLTLGAERDALRARLRTGAAWSEIVGGLPAAPPGLADALADPSWASDVPAHHGFWHLWSTVGALPRLAETDPGWRSALTAFSQVVERLAERDPVMPLAPYLEAAEDDDYEASPLLRHDHPAEDRLSVTTLHQAKGLEFDVVFIADAVDGILPDLRRSASILGTHLLPAARRDPVEAARFRIEEEMRLAYTAMTRARERVVWTATAAGLDETEERPSRLLEAVADGPSGAPDAPAGPPVTPLEAEALLRRTLADPGAPAADRLAALATLADASLPHLRPAGTIRGVAAPGPTVGLVRPDAAFSPSQAMAYADCPRRYALERHLGVGDEPSVYMAFGTLVHDVAEQVDRAAKADGRVPVGPDALAVLARRFDPADFGGPPWSDHWYRRAETALGNLFDHPPGAATPVLVEHPVELSIAGERWRGRVDRIDAGPDGVRVIDYKTSKTPVTKQAAAESLQLGFYALAAGSDPKVTEHGDVTGAEFWYPLAKDGAVDVRTFDLARLGSVETVLTDIAAAIRAERFPPTVSSGCDRCAVRILCDAWPDGAEAFVP
jgi:RecB family exonuclease